MELGRCYMMVKDWFVEKEQRKAACYNIWFVAKRKDHLIEVIDGYQTLDVEILGESEKAVQVRIESGDVVGSCKGWKTWIPKSLMKIEEE